MENKKFLILGSDGFLGSYLINYLNLKKIKIFKHSRKKNKKYNFSLTDSKILSKNLDKLKPDVIVNLAAKTNVEQCEQNVMDSYTSNVEILSALEKSYHLIKKKFFLVHISTDQLYSGNGPHKENKINPINIYSMTKALGENYALKINSVILRTNFLGLNTKKKKSLLDWFIEKIKKKKKIFLFNNIFFSPLNASLLCKIIFFVGNKRIKGIYNLGCKGKISKADFLIQLGRKLNLDIKRNNIIKTNFKKISQLVERPKDMSMKVDKFEKKFKIRLPNYNEVINSLVDEYEKK